MAFGAGIDARVKERTQEAAVAKQDPQKLVVINVDIVEASRVEQVVPVDKDATRPAVAKLPGRTCLCVEMHPFTPLE